MKVPDSNFGNVGLLNEWPKLAGREAALNDRIWVLLAADLQTSVTDWFSKSRERNSNDVARRRHVVRSRARRERQALALHVCEKPDREHRTASLQAASSVVFGLPGQYHLRDF